MAKTHYETLGIPPSSKSSEIKAAYRKLVLKHHPDRNPDPAASQIFRGITEAFEVLGEPVARQRYDETLALHETRKKEESARAAQEDERRRYRLRQEVEFAQRSVVMEPEAAPRGRTQFSARDVAEMVKRLEIFFARQRVADSESLARQIIQADPRQPFPYAVLGDIARSRGTMADAMKMYAYALQMDPTNAIYLKRYEEILDRIQIDEGKGHRVKIEPQEKRMFALLAISAISLLACIYVVVSPERAVLSDLGFISTWTVGSIAMLFLAGASAGAALSIGNLVDSVDAYSNGKISPTLLYGLVALLSFPASAILYGLFGLVQRATNVTTSRMMGTVAGITMCLALASAASSAGAASPETSFLQVFCWGGNLVYLGAMGGWTLTDNLRR